MPTTMNPKQVRDLPEALAEIETLKKRIDVLEDKLAHCVTREELAEIFKKRNEAALAVYEEAKNDAVDAFKMDLDGKPYPKN